MFNKPQPQPTPLGNLFGSKFSSVAMPIIIRHYVKNRVKGHSLDDFIGLNVGTAKTKQWMEQMLDDRRTIDFD